jgi:HEPN domain-containing protein
MITQEQIEKMAEHELSFSDAVTESICFHCQQAVEKSLKCENNDKEISIHIGL